MSEELFKIDRDNNKRDFKKILIYGAIAFLVFVIGIVSFAIYKNSVPKNEDNVLPPEVKKEPIFKQIPVEKKSVVDVNGGNDDVLNQQIPIEQNNQSTIQQNTQDIISENNITADNNIVTKPSQPSNELTKKSVNTTKKAKNNIQKEKTTNSYKQIFKNVATQSVEPKYYIQVAALLKSKQPSKKFLELIKQDGFNYKILKTYTLINNKKIKVTKVLIGPFDSKKEALKSLKKVRKFISKTAFIIKVK